MSALTVWSVPKFPDIHTVGRRCTVRATDGYTVFVLDESKPSDNLRMFHVEEGFLCDGDSVPKVVPAWVVEHTGSGEKAPCGHDKLYRTLGCGGQFTRAECDAIYLGLMLDDDVPEHIARRFYIGVRAGGWWTWWKYQRAAKRAAKRGAA